MTIATGANALVGVDVGGSGVKAALVDVSTGTATGRIRVETPQPATPDAVVASIVGLVHQLAGTGAIGCTMPAVVTNGVVRTATHIDQTWIGTHAATMLSRATDRPCVVLNDADLSCRRLVVRLEHHRARSVPAGRARGRVDRSDREPAVLRRSEQRGEARGRVEARRAPPIHRSGARDERCRPPIAQECIVLESGH